MFDAFNSDHTLKHNSSLSGLQGIVTKLHLYIYNPFGAKYFFQETCYSEKFSVCGSDFLEILQYISVVELSLAVNKYRSWFTADCFKPHSHLNVGELANSTLRVAS